MFSYLPNIKRFSSATLTIDELVDLIRENPEKANIELIRSIEYKCKAYIKIKETLPCIMVHGIFTGLQNDDFESESGFLYYDIDGFTCDDDLVSTIDKLCREFPIAMICRSCGGRGISMLIKVHCLNQWKFDDIHMYVESLLKNKGFDIDTAAGGLSRKMIISYDKNVVYNRDNVLVIDNDSLIKFIKDINNSKNKGGKKEIQYTLDETFIDKEIISLKELYETIKLATTYDKEIVGDFVIDEQESYTILIPKKIMDGNKHRIYARTVYGLHYLNPSITFHEVFSFMYHVNKVGTPSMPYKKLLILVKNLCKSIKKEGNANVTTRTKKIHFNQSRNFTTKDKQVMSAKINGQLISNKTIIIINETKVILKLRNIKPTQKAVAAESGLSISTIKRKWKEKTIEIADLNFGNKIEGIKKCGNMLRECRDEFDFYGDELCEAERYDDADNDDGNFFDGF